MIAAKRLWSGVQASLQELWDQWASGLDFHSYLTWRERRLSYNKIRVMFGGLIDFCQAWSELGVGMAVDIGPSEV